MKTTIKNNNILKAVMLLFMVTVGFGLQEAAAQKYGGSAYVHVRNTKTGETRVLNATITDICNSVSEAKSKLKSRLSTSYPEEFDSQVYYSIDQHNYDDDRKWGGSAAVRVKNTKTGDSRVLNATITAICNSAAEAKSKLESRLRPSYPEVYISGISYDIDSE